MFRTLYLNVVFGVLFSVHCHCAAGAPAVGEGNHREVLQVVGARVGVARVVRRHARWIERIDTEQRVGVDRGSRRIAFWLLFVSTKTPDCPLLARSCSPYERSDAPDCVLRGRAEANPMWITP